MIDLLLFALLLQEPEPIRVTTRMVEVGVLAHDRSGRPVAGLQAEDFRVLDGGNEESIRAFSASGTTRLSAAESRVHTVVLLDFFNSVFRNESFGRNELLRVLRTLEPSHPVALLALENGLDVLHDFTTDAGSLLRALERHRPYRPIQAGTHAPSRATGKYSRAAPIPGIEKIDAVARAYYQVVRTQQTASGIRALAAFLARTPGRKNLIWVSSVFPGALAAAVRGDDVAVYPIDVTAPIDGPTPAARMLAERTGGVAFAHGNDVAGGIRQAYADSASVYLIGYYPSHGQWDGRFRSVRLTVKQPEVMLRHRAGYVAALDGSFAVPDQRETLWQVAAAPADARAVAFTAKAWRPVKGAAQLALALDAQAGELEVMAVPVRGNGDLMDADYFKLQKVEKEATHAIAPPPEARRLRVVVRDCRTGALGSATVSIAAAK